MLEMASAKHNAFELRQLSQTSLLNTHHQSTGAGAYPQTPSLSWLKFIVMGIGLSVTTIVSLFLLIAATMHWTLPKWLYDFVVGDRATVQLVVQVLSNALALIWVTLVCMIINYTSRVYFKEHPVAMNTIRLWHSLCSRSLVWSLPIQLMLLVLLFNLITAIPSGIWAGALTPVSTTKQIQGSISLPSYQDTSNIKEYPSEVHSTGPTLRSPLGYFTYSVGVQMQGSLLASASAATSVDGSVRQHSKLDYTHFNYFGRSYGVGASVGLSDSAVLGQSLHLSYSFIETGFETSVSCLYNSTSDYKLQSDTGYGPDVDTSRFAATGELPNSIPGEPEFSVYFGHGPKAIVAIGVGRDWNNPRPALGIAAGEYYKHLDKIQCAFDFKPTVFNVSVGVAERNITVTPIRSASAFNPQNLTQVLTRQFELIANDQTNIYVSLVGNSLNASISDYIISQNSTTHEMTLEQATPTGLANAFKAMADDMLVAYAGAQLMIADQSYLQYVTITKAAVKVGENIYIRAVFGINIVVIVVVIAEAMRTKLWRKMLTNDYMDPADLIWRSERTRQGQDELFTYQHKGLRKVSAASAFGYDRVKS